MYTVVSLTKNECLSGGNCSYIVWLSVRDLHGPTITTCVRSTREDHVLTRVCLCACPHKGGVSTLDRGYLPWTGYLPWMGGTCLGHGRSLARGVYLGWGYPPLAGWMRVSPQRQSSVARTCYTASSMHLAFMQRDILVSFQKILCFING